MAKETSRLTIYLESDLRTEFRMLCAALDISMNEQTNKLIAEFVEKHKGAVQINPQKLNPVT